MSVPPRSLFLILVALCTCVAAKTHAGSAKGGQLDDVYVSYAYYEKDDKQRKNLQFFLTVGAGYAKHYFRRPAHVFFQIIVAGDLCTPCQDIEHNFMLARDTGGVPGVRKAVISKHTTVLYRHDNVGMDIASHGVGLQWLTFQLRLNQFKYFIFLNSSVRGPFYPSYMPAEWQWTDAFVGALQRGNALAACSIVCLPDIDAGGPGPRAESWAFALDRKGLNVALQRAVFGKRHCKLCPNGIVVAGEYGLSTSILDAGLNMTTLMTKYGKDVDWKDTTHWRCNNNVHPSRDGTYDGVSQHPLELLFVKSSWRVAEQYVAAYSRWANALAAGSQGTDGEFDKAMYTYAISPEAIKL
jgi:hypothetical protein